MKFYITNFEGRVLRVARSPKEAIRILRRYRNAQVVIVGEVEA